MRSHFTRNRAVRAVAAVALLAGLLSLSEPASAVHGTGAFQLDGDAESTTPAPPPGVDDWDKVCHEVTITNDPDDDVPDQCASAGDTTNATAVEWAADGPGATIFTGGGSKDAKLISEWAYKDGSVPDKDDLLHSFAARYSLPPDADTCPAGTFSSCDVLFFGSDRIDNSGDAHQGFWFFQDDEIGLGTNSVGGGQGFTGEHIAGDLLIISGFSNGGTVSTITVYEWDPTCTKTAGPCAEANLRTLASSAAAKCSNILPATDSFCGIVNPVNGTVAPWSFTDKTAIGPDHPANTYLQGEFFEGGINLSALGLADRCFSAVASESRSSTSTTAVLKDFVLGGFGSCDTTLVTTPSAGQNGSVLIGSDGTLSVTDSAVLTVNGISEWSGSLQFAICGPIDSPATCSSGGTDVGSPIAVTESTVQPIVSAAATVTSVGRYCWRAEFTSATEGVPDAEDSSATECFTVTAAPTAITTRQFVYPQDKAVITATAGGNLAGNVAFKLYDTLANCNANTATGLLYAPAAFPIAGASPQSAQTNNTTVAVTTSTTVFWRVTYTSTNLSQLDSSSVCTESTQVTYAGNDSGITVP